MTANNTALTNASTSNVATLNTKFANYYTAISSDARCQMVLTTTSPLSITSNTLAIDLSNYSTPAKLSTAVANLVNSAPATLDTLTELAASLNKDPSFATTITTLIGTKQAQITATLPLTPNI